MTVNHLKRISLGHKRNKGRDDDVRCNETRCHIVGCTQIRWLLERNAEIYPGIATEPVGGTGLKATGSDTSRS